MQGSIDRELVDIGSTIRYTGMGIVEAGEYCIALQQIWSGILEEVGVKLRCTFDSCNIGTFVS